ncbi:TetR/AcrR family transcriptional regulator [Streptomyces himalayensis]|uniref:TetR/AcrR family transcriptional regulator n=1 Tax=Streptomyces himalayensis TaxID=2820085 RepID=UPI0028680719|nr:TetR/AcrR family transcriptional regulator [Streptomyces himalayensis]
MARRAGVGAGTVYRHFPSKQVLLEAVLVQHMDDLAAAGRRRMARSAPTEAFFAFLLDVIEKSRGRQHVCDVVTADESWPRQMLAAAAQRFRQVLTALLHGAQRAGGVRAGIGPDDVTSLTVGCAAMLAVHRDRAAGIRLVHLTLDALRPSASVTELHTFRDAGGTTPAARCEECGTSLPCRPTGRPARYCGATCRQRARRRRLAG